MPEESNTQNSSVQVSQALPLKRKRGRDLSTTEAKRMAAKAKKSPRHGKHGKLKTTLAIEDAYRRIQEKIIERSMKLIDTQTLLAHGTIKIFRIGSHWEGTGKNKKLVKEKPVLVDKTDEIAEVLDFTYGDGEQDPDDEDYYFVTTKDPDNRAIKDQLDRIGLKAPDKVDVTTKGEEIKQIVIINPDGGK